MCTCVMKGHLPFEKTNWPKKYKLATKLVKHLQERASTDDGAFITKSMLWRDSVTSVGSFCTGVDSPGESLSMIEGACAQCGPELPSFSWNNNYTCEKNKKLRLFLTKRHGGGPHQSACCYKNILDFLPKAVLAKIAELEATNEKPFEEMKKLIFECELLDSAPCEVICLYLLTHTL